MEDLNPVLQEVCDFGCAVSDPEVLLIFGAAFYAMILWIKILVVSSYLDTGDLTKLLLDFVVEQTRFFAGSLF